MEFKLILYILFYLFIGSKSIEFLSLDGNDWIATNNNGTINVTSNVPGNIYTDLWRNGILEDPYFRYNDVNYRWVGHENWIYEKLFNVNHSILNNDGVFLVFYGIDTVSRIYINYALIGTTDNMFVRYKFNIKPFLRSGVNYIHIAFESAVLYGKRKHDEEVRVKYIIPPECPVDKQNGECHVNFVRKMQASFSWDWGPAFPTQGIWKHICIESYNYAIIRDVLVNTLKKTNSDGIHQWTLNATVYMESVGINAFHGTLKISLNEHILFIEDYYFRPLSDGTIKVNLLIPINETIPIIQWWPNGVGFGIQPLYLLKTSLISQNTEVSDKTVRIGFRTIELIQDPITPKGLTFYFKVNDFPFFAKGSNWIPAHVFTDLASKEYIRNLLQSAKDANMNMLRVWGGGIYENDEFYEIADEFGILIWHDLMFACALYPTNNEFLHSVGTEVTQQIRRLQHHASIALWAGNNENEAAIAQFWWPEIMMRQKDYKNDYITLYINHIKPIVLSEDPSRPYLSSSPSNGLETEKENWISRYPQDNKYGDVHYYNYGPTAWEWAQYPSAKFASEYGFQSYPSFGTLQPVTIPSDWTYPISPAIEDRQHHTGGTSEIEGVIGNYMKLPAPGGVERFKDLIYLSQISQAMSIKTETEFYRRNRLIDSLGNGFTMGALYWQLNDIWQGQSWASIEFGGKWKMLHYYVKNMFKNLLISPYEDNGILNIAAVRDDYWGRLPFNLTISVYRWSSLTPMRIFRIPLDLNSSTVEIIYHRSISDILNASNCSNRNECFIYFIFENSNNNMRAENFLFLSPLKSVNGLIRPNLRITSVTGPVTSMTSESKYKYSITLETNSVSLFVLIDFIDSANLKGTFSDNGFLMIENSKRIYFYTENRISSNELKTKLTVRSLTDVKTQ